MKLSAPPAAVRAVASMLEEADLHMKWWDADDGSWESSPCSRRVQGDGRANPERSGYLYFKHYHYRKKEKKTNEPDKVVLNRFVPPGLDKTPTIHKTFAL